MLNTHFAELNESWSSLFEGAGEPRLRHGLSRFARWASERQIGPAEVNEAVFDRFIADLESGSLVRKIPVLRQDVVRAWNALAKTVPNAQLQAIPVRRRRNKNSPPRFPWMELPESFRQDVDQYQEWASVPDPLDDNARSKALAPRTVDLRRDHIHSAVTAAVAAGVSGDELVNLGCLTQPEVFKEILRQRWEAENRKLSAYTHGVAGSLVAIATEWVKIPENQLMELKKIRQKLGSMNFGMTDKNKAFLRKFDNRQTLRTLLNLPDKLWRQLTSDLKTTRRGFVELQSGLAIEIELEAPLRMQNLSALEFDKQLQWPNGFDKPACVVIAAEESKNRLPLEFELPQTLSDRLATYRNEIAPRVTGVRPDHLFVAWNGKPRTQATVALAIENTVLKYVGVRLTPHQFRHLAAKLRLDENPGAIELVSQLMGHKNSLITARFYGGIDTKRAGRAHSALISQLKRDL